MSAISGQLPPPENHKAPEPTRTSTLGEAFSALVSCEREWRDLPSQEKVATTAPKFLTQCQVDASDLRMLSAVVTEVP